jgi:DNA-binding transcriptional MerR regulator
MRYLSPSEAAKRLGVSAKALRLYEEHGLVAPARTAAGWRAYSPDQMIRASEIVALRGLGLSLAEIHRVLTGEPDGLEPALAAHHAALESRLGELTRMVERVHSIRADLARGRAPVAGELAHLLRPASKLNVSFELPWPWGGELFDLSDIRPINYIIGPLGSGKTRLALRIAETLPGAVFLGLDRLSDGGATARSECEADAALKRRVEKILTWLLDEGATVSMALETLVVGLESEGPVAVVVDMIEQGLDQSTQEALGAHLRQRGRSAGRPLFLLTRSSAILDLSVVGPDDAIIFCPANHSPPTRVAPYLGAPGFEGVATCLASPDVRARTEGVVAWRPVAS